LATIYVRVLNKGTDVWRSVEAVHLRGNQYLIASVNRNPEDEVWQFRTWEAVHCAEHSFSDGTVLMAYAPSDLLYFGLRPGVFWVLVVVWQVAVLGDVLFWFGAPDKFNVMNAVALMAAGFLGTLVACLALLVSPAVRGFALRKGANVSYVRKVAAIVCLLTGFGAFACLAYWYRAYLALP
jgi:hypothetical protein